MRQRALAAGLALGLLLAGSAVSGPAEAAPINILDLGDTGTTADGTIFLADPDPTHPSTGTGVFEPFVRIQKSTGGGGGLQNGYNTDTSGADINFNTKDGSEWTRSVRFGELAQVEFGTAWYYVLSLDANQCGSAGSGKNRITLTDMQIYIADDDRLATPEAFGGYTGTPFGDIASNGLLGLSPVWALDSEANGDVSVVLQASIWTSPGQGGSGHGDMDVFIPASLLSGDENDFFVLYTEYSGANDGFEEWRFDSGPPQVPESATVSMLVSGLMGLGVLRRWRRKS